MTYSDFEQLIVNGTAGVDTFNVTSTAAGTATTINAGDSADLFGTIDLTTVGAAGLTIDADLGAGEVLTLNVSTAGTTTITGTTVQRTGNGLVTYSNLESLLVNGTGGVDTFNVLSSSIVTAIDAGLGPKVARRSRCSSGSFGRKEAGLDATVVDGAAAAGAPVATTAAAPTAAAPATTPRRVTVCSNALTPG